MHGEPTVPRCVGRRRALAGLLGISASGLAMLAACKQPVPPAGATRPPASAPARVPPTPAPLQPLKVGLLFPGRIDLDTTPSGRFVAAVRAGGFTLAGAPSRWFTVDPHRLMTAPHELAAVRDEVLGHDPEILFAPSTAAAVVARQGTSTVPIVAIAPDDLVGLGLVRNLARPGGNLTGLTTFDPHRAARPIELLEQVVPSLGRIGVVWSPDEYDRDAYAAELVAAASTRGLQADALPARNPDEAIDAVQKAVQQRIDALISLGDPYLSAHQALVASLAQVHRLPTMFERPELVRSGGLLSLGPDVGRLWQLAGEYVVRIARGASPADLAVTHDATRQVTVNLTTARALGLQVPASLVRQAAEVVP